MVADRFAIDLNGSRIVVIIDILGNILLLLPPPRGNSLNLSVIAKSSRVVEKSGNADFPWKEGGRM